MNAQGGPGSGTAPSQAHYHQGGGGTSVTRQQFGAGGARGGGGVPVRSLTKQDSDNVMTPRLPLAGETGDEAQPKEKEGKKKGEKAQ